MTHKHALTLANHPTNCRHQQNSAGQYDMI